MATSEHALFPLEPWQYPAACWEFEPDPHVLYWCVTCGFAMTKHIGVEKWVVGDG